MFLSSQFVLKSSLKHVKHANVNPPPPVFHTSCSDLMDRLRTGGQAALADGFIDPLQVIEEILRQPEFIFEKPSYDKYHKSRLPQQPLPGYPPSILPADTFLLIINAFTETCVYHFLLCFGKTLPSLTFCSVIPIWSLARRITFKSCQLSPMPI